MKRISIMLLLFCCHHSALAHKSSDSYISLDIHSDVIQGQWDVALRDLEFALGLDANNDGNITWGELRQAHPRINAYLTDHLTLSRDNQPCPMQVNGNMVDRHSDGGYAIMLFSARCSPPETAIDIQYSLLFELDRQHRGLIRIRHEQGEQTMVFGPDSATRHIQFDTLTPFNNILAFTEQGFIHILAGYDHVIFLLTLLIPAVLYRWRRQWLPCSDFKASLRDTAITVTAFTLAHSITLALSALGIFQLPSRLVETAIALSVLLVAVSNLSGIGLKLRWQLTFLFGLVHGLGFAGVLQDLLQNNDQRLTALLGFNLGVELGQLAVVALFLPLAFLVRRHRFYRVGIHQVGSYLIISCSLLWIIERGLDIKLL